MSNWEATICDANDPIDCANLKNQFCAPCLTPDAVLLLNQITSEYLNRNWFQLVSPLPISHRQAFIEDETKLAKFQRSYFHARCADNSEWCQKSIKN